MQARRPNGDPCAGRLVQGAIIACGHGLPCVTGAPRPAELTAAGVGVTVDAWLCIVVAS